MRKEEGEVSTHQPANPGAVKERAGRGLVTNGNLAEYLISFLPRANMSFIYNSAPRAPSC